MKKRLITVMSLSLALMLGAFGSVWAAPDASSSEELNMSKVGGGYAITGQLGNVGYSAVVYDASSGLPTSDAMYLSESKDGYIWIGGYSGVIRYDGTSFERLDTSDGLTSARGFFEDSRNRIWVATNDNGVVVLEGDKRTHYTYKDGLAASSVRAFAEDKSGDVFVGTTAGLSYVTPDGLVYPLSDERLDKERVLKLEADSAGVIYGSTSSGIIFSIKDRKIDKVYSSSDLGMNKISTFMVDPKRAGRLYIGDAGEYMYHGDFGDNKEYMTAISTAPLDTIHWMCYACDRVWVISTTKAGYLDSFNNYYDMPNLPVNTALEMITSDYQGNIWIASSKQGIMKLVTSSFMDVTKDSSISGEVVNAVCKRIDDLYIGTDNGLRILDSTRNEVANELTARVGSSRVRAVIRDASDNIWVGTYTGGTGLVCQDAEGNVKTYNTESGMSSNEIRCLKAFSDGSIVAGTNAGVTVIKDGEIIRNIGKEEGMNNSVVMTVEEGLNGRIIAGTDGGGIYEITGSDVKKIGRDEGLTSDVIMRIKKDNARDLYWIVTSNSIQYNIHGEIKEVSSFPYSNSYDIYFGSGDSICVLASNGVYMVKASEMLSDEVKDYRLYGIMGAVPYPITGNSFSTEGERGYLYIAGRKGVIGVNINRFFDDSTGLKSSITSLYCDDERIFPDEKGVYNIPASEGRIRITPAVMDYTNTNPMIRVFLEGSGDSGITVYRDKLADLEYTGLRYGDYKLHIQVLGSNGSDVLSDKTVPIVKRPKILELTSVRIIIILLLIFAAGFAVWRFLKSTVIHKQYEEIRQARDEAERSNEAKTKFLANISHEIRTPINTIMGMDEMILREDATNVPKGYFMSMMNYAWDIKNASESLLGLINDLLDMSKIESGKMHLVEQEYDVADMLRSIAAMIRVRSTQKELTFDVIIDEILPRRLYGDEGKIKQVVLNLLTNAVKYTSVGGFALYVSMTERENNMAKLLFSVKDTGMGVKEEDLDKLFTAYERLDEEKNSAIQGTGLGLDISRRFAEMMGGTLTVESVYGEGSEFVLTVKQRIVDPTPLGVFVEHDDSEKGPYVPQFIAPDADILVVDDNPMNLSVMRGLLKGTKVFVTTAESGEECLELVRNNHFHVVLLDHMMPGMDGLETMAKIREFDKDLPVYALTANASAGEEFYKERGFNGYLSKPVDTLTLEKTIKVHIPEEMMIQPEQADAVEDLTELPAEMSWVREIEELSVDDGITNSGGISGFIFALQLFYETIDGNAKVIQEAYDSDNIRLYTIKVHALKTSARIIGASGLSELAQKLENAGNAGDRSFIDGHTDEFMNWYISFKDKLSRLEEEESSDEGKEPIPEEELEGAYEALREFVPQMDYDSVEMILDQLSEYKLPEEDSKKLSEMKKLLKLFEWDKIEALITE